jgi:hypothetical protein
MRALYVALARTTAGPARRARPRDDRAALVGRARAALWPTIACGSSAAHRGGQVGARAAALPEQCGGDHQRRLAPGLPRLRRRHRQAHGRRAARVPHYGIDVADPERALVRGAWAGSRRLARLGFAARRARRSSSGAPGSTSARSCSRCSMSRRSDPDRRARSRANSARCPHPELRRWCERLDPRAPGGTHAAAARRRGGAAHRRSASATGTPPAARRAPSAVRYLVVDPGRRCEARIADRVDAMLAAGWEDEVRALDGHVPPDAPAWNATGYERRAGLVEGGSTVSGDRASASSSIRGSTPSASAPGSGTSSSPARRDGSRASTPREAGAWGGGGAGGAAEASRRVKIGITCYPTYGGSGAVATELGIALAARGHEVHFITYQQPFRLPGVPAPRLLPRGGRRALPAVRVPALRPGARRAHARGGASSTARPAARALRHSARHQRVDRARDAARGRATSGHHHAARHRHHARGAGASFHAITKFSIEKSDRITAVSQYLRDETSAPSAAPAARSR